MKNIRSLIVIGCIILSGLGAAAVSADDQELSVRTESLSFSQPVLLEKNQYTIVELSQATSYLAQTGKPYLPMVSKVYIFPFGTMIANVDASYNSLSELSFDKPLMLSPEPQIVSTKLTLNTQHQVIAPHSTETWYPSSPFTYRAGSGLHDGEHVLYLAVQLYPIQCSSAGKKIRYYEDATISISYQLPAHPMSFGDAYDLLILTPAQFTNQLQPLVTYKNENEVPTIMVTLNDIPHVGADVQEDIKYYIKDAIETWGITNVLLVGAGVKDAEIFPVRNAWIPSDDFEQYFPSDLYYADIYNWLGLFSDWDYDNDGRYCELPADLLAVDLYPDVNLGRLACNDAGEVTAIVNKIIDFKEHNKVLNKIVQLGGDTFTDDDDHVNEGEYANTKVMMELPGYTSTKLWASLGTLTKDNIRSNINRAVDFVDCSGHGAWSSWATHPPRDDSIWLPEKTTISPYHGFLYIDVDLFFNSKKLPVFVMNACSTSKFSENPNCLSWKIVSKSNGGGIASFGASGIGYGMMGTHEVERLWGWMEVHLFEQLYQTKHLGEVWSNTLTEYINSFFLEEGDYKTIVETAMFGDPTTVIDNGKDPQSYSAACSTTQSLFHYRTVLQNSLVSVFFSFLNKMKGQ
ncbi:MAG: hypothetical protein JW840_01365 [Candidatus Thermoplasmatota archaeon]|nr:hypothetical protein [Candidatus Thermoplasmatota archaeon]